MLVVNGKRRSMNSRHRNVGIGSKKQDFAGDVEIMRRNSVCEHERNDKSEECAVWSTVGGG